jgi:cytochrome c oxidase subunit 2
MHVDRTERIFIIGSVVLVIVFALAIAVSSIAFGIQVPRPEMLVDPRTVATPGVVPGFGDPVEERVRELAPGNYEAYIMSQTWVFQPSEIRVPAGSRVTFFVTSKDVQHGFKVDNTNINVMVIPGQISRMSATFDEPGTYNFICHEYCGAGHHTMFGRLIVE